MAHLLLDDKAKGEELLKKGSEKKKQRVEESNDDVLKDRYELLWMSRKRYKRLKVEAVANNHQWQMDLANLKYLERYNSNVRYLLVFIDVYSHYLWVKKLRNKNLEIVYKKFIEILMDEKKLGSWEVPLKHLQCDRGGEFSHLARDNVFDGKEVKLHFGSNYKMKAVVVERVIGTLKMISGVLLGVYGTDVSIYTQFLDLIVERHNESYHSSLDCNSPQDVYLWNVVLPLSFLYQGYFDFKPFMWKGTVFNEGDKVRVSVMKVAFFKRKQIELE